MLNYHAKMSIHCLVTQKNIVEVSVSLTAPTILIQIEKARDNLEIASR